MRKQVVRVEARLANAADDALARRGTLELGSVRRYTADALVDTGSVRLVIPPQVMAELGLASRGRRMAEYADGRREAVDVTEPLIVEIEGRDTVEEALVLGDEVLIGQTVLEKLDLYVDGAPGPTGDQSQVTRPPSRSSPSSAASSGARVSSCTRGRR